jgi:hypothetical protein
MAMFARRPKLTGREHLLAGNVNDELIQFSRAAQTVGIPTFAGFPAVDSVFSLYRTPPVFWLHLDESSSKGFSFFTDISVQSPRPIGMDGSLIKMLSLERITGVVEERAAIFRWDEVMKLISELRLQHYRYNFSVQLAERV